MAIKNKKMSLLIKQTKAGQAENRITE